MANLKAIRDRIQSVKILRKLQKPCALAAAVRRAQQQVIATRPLPTAWRSAIRSANPSAI